MEAIASRLEAIASRLEAIGIRLEAQWLLQLSIKNLLERNASFSLAQDMGAARANQAEPVETVEPELRPNEWLQLAGAFGAQREPALSESIRTRHQPFTNQMEKDIVQRLQGHLVSSCQRLKACLCACVSTTAGPCPELRINISTLFQPFASSCQRHCRSHQSSSVCIALSHAM